VTRKLSRKEIKKDPFVTATLNAWEYTREHQGIVFAGLIILLVVIAGAVWMRNARRGGRIEAVTQFSEALGSFRTGDIKTAEQLFGMVESNHGSTREGVHAAYFAGKCALIEDNYTGAIEAFDRYLSKSNKHNEFRDAALDGKGIALMNQQRYGEAAELFSELAGSLETNTFMEAVYLRRAAESYKLDNQPERAVELMRRLLEKSTGVERRDLEVEIAILGG
jgi:outer membrane protein assembly factor BamD (BamD/ComL family)